MTRLGRIPGSIGLLVGMPNTSRMRARVLCTRCAHCVQNAIGSTLAIEMTDTFPATPTRKRRWRGTSLLSPVIPPTGSLYEAFFDPVALSGGGVGANDREGVFVPAAIPTGRGVLLLDRLKVG